MIVVIDVAQVIPASNVVCVTIVTDVVLVIPDEG